MVRFLPSFIGVLTRHASYHHVGRSKSRWGLGAARFSFANPLLVNRIPWMGCPTLFPKRGMVKQGFSSNGSGQKHISVAYRGLVRGFCENARLLAQVGPESFRKEALLDE